MKSATLMDRLAAFLVPRLGELLLVCFFFAGLGLGPRMMNIDGDLGRHLTLGRHIFDTRKIPTEDIFSFTKYGDSLTPHEWLSDVLFAQAYQILGLDGVVLLTAGVLAAAFWLIYRHSLNLSNMSLLAALGALLGAAASSFHWLTRPHIFTILIAVIWTQELEKMRLGIRKSPLIFPLLMLIWVNLHGAFLAGFVIWAPYLLESLLEGRQAWSKTRILGGVGLACFLVSFLNPDGFGIWRTGFEFLGSQYLVSHTAEYLPPDFQSLTFWPFLGLLFTSLFLMGSASGKMPLSRALLVSGWTVLALISARNIPIYAAVSVPFLAAVGAEILREGIWPGWVSKLFAIQNRIMDIEKGLRGGLWTAAAVLAATLLLWQGVRLDFGRTGNSFSEDIFPVQAVHWMDSHQIDGRVFNHFPWGGYLLYRTWPERLVFIDGQTDFYGEELTREYERVITLHPGWQEILLKYQVDWALLPTDSQLAAELEYEEFWELAYQDRTATLLKRPVLDN